MGKGTVSASVLLKQSKDVSFIEWLLTLKLKIAFWLREAYRYINRRTNTWLRMGLIVRASLPAVPFTLNKRNKHAFVAGLIAVAAMIFAWKSYPRKLRPSTAPQGSEESITSIVQKDSQSDQDENSPLEEADVKDMTVFDKRRLEDSEKNLDGYRIIYPLSKSLQPQSLDNIKQDKLLMSANALIVPPPTSESWDKFLPNRFSEVQLSSGFSRNTESQKQTEFKHRRRVATLHQEVKMHNVKPDSLFDNHFTDLPHRVPLEEKEPDKLLNLSEDENVESRTENICSDSRGVYSDCKTELASSWTTPLEFRASLTSSEFSPGDVTSTIKKFPSVKPAGDLVATGKTSTSLHSSNTGMHRPSSHPHNENDAARKMADVSYAEQSSPMNTFADFIPGSWNYRSHLVPVVGRDKQEKGVSLLRSNCAVDYAYDNAPGDSEPGQNSLLSSSNKLEQETQQRLYMYELLDDGDRSKYNIRHSQGYYQEKLRTYDKYLADPKLTAQMRSQVQRAKSYLQSYFENDS